MDVVEQVGNALSDGAGNISERKLAADSDAVPSVLYPEQQKLGTLLANAEGGASAALRAAQAVCDGFAAWRHEDGDAGEGAGGAPGPPAGPGPPRSRPLRTLPFPDWLLGPRAERSSVSPCDQPSAGEKRKSRRGRRNAHAWTPLSPCSFALLPKPPLGERNVTHYNRPNYLNLK